MSDQRAKLNHMLTCAVGKVATYFHRYLPKYDLRHGECYFAVLANREIQHCLGFLMYFS